MFGQTREQCETKRYEKDKDVERKLYWEKRRIEENRRQAEYELKEMADWGPGDCGIKKLVSNINDQEEYDYHFSYSKLKASQDKEEKPVSTKTIKPSKPENEMKQ